MVSCLDFVQCYPPLGKGVGRLAIVDGDHVEEPRCSFHLMTFAMHMHIIGTLRGLGAGGVGGLNFS